MNQHLSSRLVGVLLGMAVFVRICGAQAPEAPIPIVEPQSLGLIKVDLNHVNLPQIQKWLLEVMTEMKLPDADLKQITAGIDGAFAQMEQARAALVQAGASSLYISISQADMRYGPSIYLPVDPAQGAPDLVASIIYSGRVDGPRPPDPATVRAPSMQIAAPLGGGVYFGPLLNFQRYQANKGTSPALLKALADAPAGMAQGAFVSSPELNALLEAQMPTLPPPINQPMTVLTRGLKSASAGIQPPPGPSGALLIQASDAAAAAQFKTIIEQLIPLAGAMLKAQDNNFDPQPLIDAIKPQVAGDKLTLLLDDVKLRKAVVGPLGTALIRARQTATAVQSASQIRQIVVSAVTFAQANRGALPKNLAEINMNRASNPRALRQDLPGFIYVKTAETLAQAPRETPIVYENPAALPPGIMAVNAGFPDGSVRLMPVAEVLRLVAPAAK